ncbi:MAG: aminotransferase class V-fold PLP-dependent enzyme [Steroidobacteraceae bacterium]
MNRDLVAALELARSSALDYRARIAQRAPRPAVEFAELEAAFDLPLPQQRRSAEEVVRDLIRAAEPGLMANAGPNFFGWVQGASHPSGVAADWLTSAWGQNAGLYRTSPAAAVAEIVAGRWILDLLDLPRQSLIGFATGATTAGLTCLLVARDRVLAAAGWNLRERGMFGAPAVTVLLGEEAHSTIFAALRYLGFGECNLLRVAVDDQGRMIAAHLAQQLADRRGPKIVVAQAGHINSGACDPLESIAELARAHAAWLHIDGAFGLWARAAPALKSQCRGAELADSWSVDGHKWLQVPYDCAFAIVRDTKAQQESLQIAASYLDQPPEGAYNPSSLVLELSRRARGFTVWTMLQTLGRDGLAELVMHHCRCAGYLRDRLAVESGIKILNDVVLNQLAIAFAVGAPESEQARLTDAVIEAIQRENRSYVGPASWKGLRIMRVSVVSGETEIAHMEILANSILAAWRRIAPAGDADGAPPAGRH